MIDLTLDIADTFNLKIMRLFDTSCYPEDQVVDNYLIEVLAPNKTKWVVFNVSKNFNLILNSSNLRYNIVSEVKQLVDLPDGIYEIKQSYKPNIKTVSHFYHLRVSAVKLKLMDALGKHFSDECKKEKRVYEQEALSLTKAREYIDAAVYSVEHKHDKEKGIKFYNMAVDLLNEFENDCRC